MTTGDLVVLDGDLLLENQIDGDVSLDISVDGDCSSVIKVKDRLTQHMDITEDGDYDVKDYASVTVDVEEDYEWRKPEDWPDLESIELPGSWDTSTLYLLYDRSCGVDNVSVTCDGRVAEVYRGTVENGQFVGELIGRNV